MNITWKQTLYQYFMVTLACIIMGVALNVFYMPNKMLSGGIGGVAVLAYYIGVFLHQCMDLTTCHGHFI